MEKYILMLTTADDIVNAETIAKTLVEKHLAACCNVIPKITSFYRWEGEVTKDNEVLILIKTRKELFEKVQETIINLNLYELPEIISFDISNGYDKYLTWINSSVI